MKIPIIAITSRENSSLGQMADCILHSVSGEDYQMRTAATMSLMAQLYVVDILFICMYQSILQKVMTSWKKHVML